MEVKDWILLLVPIASNGIILYIIQLYFQSKLKHGEHKNEVKQKINAEFFALLLEAKNCFRALAHCPVDDPQSTELFSQNLVKFNLSIRNTLDYYHDYSFYLKNYSSSITQLETVFHEYLVFSDQNSTLTDKSEQQFMDYLNQLFNLISDAAERYIKEL